MNILQITLGFYPATSWGGPVKIVHQNGLELARRGHHVTVYCSNLMNKKQKIQPKTFENQIDGLRVVYFYAWHITFWPGSLGPIWWPDLGRYLRRELDSFDVVHINGYRNLIPLAVAHWARQADKPFIVQPHGAIPIGTNSILLKRLYERLVGRRALTGLSALIAGQRYEREQALSIGVPEERIMQIHNGLLPPEASSLPSRGTFRKKHNISPYRPLVLFLGRINRKKGTDMLVEAFAPLSDSSSVLVIAGPNDGQLAEVQALVQRYDLEDRVLFTGLLEDDDVWAAYRDATLFVLPCRTDTYPMAIIEACAMGTPVLTTTKCEIAHLVDGRIGETVPFDADQFAAAMERLLGDAALRNIYSENTKRVMEEEFSIQSVGDRLEKVYQAAIDGQPVNRL